MDSEEKKRQDAQKRLEQYAKEGAHGVSVSDHELHAKSLNPLMTLGVALALIIMIARRAGAVSMGITIAVLIAAAAMVAGGAVQEIRRQSKEKDQTDGKN